MIRKYSLFFLFMSYIGIFASNAQAITTSDIKLILGEWKGTLTYLDYTSKKEYTMPAEVKVSQLRNSNQLIFSNFYPNEPKANNIDTLSFSRDRGMIGKGVIKSKMILPNGNTEIVTEYNSVDGNENKPALIRLTYIFGKSIFVKRKEVRFVGEDEFVKRNEYSYSRK